MARLVASDLERRDVVHRQWSLEEGIVLPLGSGVQKDHLLVEWDQRVAPRHAVATWKEGRLFIDRCSDVPATQPIFYRGKAADSFRLIPGEGFVIGHTIFRLDPGAAAAPTASESSRAPAHFYDAEQLQTMTFHPTEEQIEAIRTLLFTRESDQADLESFSQLAAATIRRVVRSARYVAVLNVSPRERRVTVQSESDPTPGICDELVQEACRRQEVAEYRWDMNQAKQSYKPIAGVTWACCAPVIARKANQGDMAIYLSGPQAPVQCGQSPRALSEDQRVFVAIVAWLLRGVRTVHELERYQAWMQPFFPKPIRNLIQQRGPEDVFRTDRAQAAVLFCDLRGSCNLAETGASELMQSWERLQASLSVMTEAITNQYGTIGDFVGDAAMGFWGWPPIGSASRDLTEAVKAACKAADILRERFAQKARGTGPLAGFTCGMGIAAGDVVAGMLGTEDQRKIGVFGPIVNLAARLESMTKHFGSSILIDHTSAKLLMQSETTLLQQIRYLASVRPAGMEQSQKVFELMPSESDPLRLPRARLQLFEQGQREFEQGNWPEARNFLQRVLEAHDGPSRFLLDYMDQHKTPPLDWNGTVVLARK